MEAICDSIIVQQPWGNFASALDATASAGFWFERMPRFGILLGKSSNLACIGQEPIGFVHGVFVSQCFIMGS